MMETDQGAHVVGARLPRVDGYERVSGEAVYTLDVNLPGMLHVAILRCPHAHAVVTRVDANAARKMPGVRAVLTVEDPEAATVAPYPWWVDNGIPMHLLERHCRFQGEEVAAVAADTPYQAWDAARAIDLSYEQQPFVLDAAEAQLPNAPRVHEQDNVADKPWTYQRGAVESGFAASDIVIEDTYRTGCLIHSPIETFVSVATWESDHLTVWESSQGVFPVQGYLCQALNLPATSVRVICQYVGGGFGAKAQLSKYTLIAALLARKTGRPVKAALAREETFLAAGSRPANTIWLKAGATRAGDLTALEMKTQGACGAYTASAVVGHMVANLYRCQNVRSEQTTAYTNTGQIRDFRAPGFVQGAWALEQAIDKLAAGIGMDPIDFRLKNLVSTFPMSGNAYTSFGLDQCLKRGAEAFRWSAAREPRTPQTGVRRGVGVACAMWGMNGSPPGTAIVKLFADGSVNLNTGAADIGTGTKTVLSMIVAEELGMPLERIGLEYSDTATTQYAQISGGSRTVMCNAPAVRNAAIEVRRQLLRLAASEWGIPEADLSIQHGRIRVRSESGDGRHISTLKALGQRQVIIAVGETPHPPAGKHVFAFAAHFAEVEVNTITGAVTVLRLAAAHDSGRVMNALTYENQVFGGLTMGIGFAITEGRVIDRQTGRVLTNNLHDYRIPTALDVPFDKTCIPVDPHDSECNSLGAKGLGEPAMVPTAAAIANAVYHATGVRMYDAPMTPMQLLRRLQPAVKA